MQPCLHSGSDPVAALPIPRLGPHARPPALLSSSRSPCNRIGVFLPSSLTPVHASKVGCYFRGSRQRPWRCSHDDTLLSPSRCPQSQHRKCIVGSWPFLLFSPAKRAVAASQHFGQGDSLKGLLGSLGSTFTTAHHEILWYLSMHFASSVVVLPRPIVLC